MYSSGEDDSGAISNFGGSGLKYAKQSTAYMLVYIRESDWDRILCDSGKDDLVEHVRRRLEVSVFRAQNFPQELYLVA